MKSFLASKEYIERHGGIMISTSVDKNRSFLWKCNNGHENKSSEQLTRRKNWCKKCGIEQTRLKAVDRINKNGFKLISFDGIYCLFVCTNGHAQKMTTSHVIEGNKCSVCHRNNQKNGLRRLSIDEVKTRISKHGFEFIDSVYKSLNFEHQIKCENGHITKRKLRHLIDGVVGCSDCNNSFRSEKIFRNLIETTFKKPFPKSRPEWLVNPENGYRLELDCFNKELGIAFEYDGHFHFEIRKGLNNDLQRTRKLDLIKDRLCHDNGIKLIRVPHYMKKEKIIKIIREVDAGIQCPAEVKQARAEARTKVVK